MSSQIYLKPLTVEVLEAYLGFLNDPEIHRTTEPYKTFKPYAREDVRAWLNKISGLSDRADFAIHRLTDSIFMGEVVLNEVKDGSANIRIGLKSEFQNQGYGIEAMRLAIQHGFDKMNLNEITLSVFNLNPRGIHLYQKLGFVEVGRGVCEGFDEIYMSLKKSEPVSGSQFKPRS